MKRARNIFAALLAACLAFAGAACGGGNKTPAAGGDNDIAVDVPAPTFDGIHTATVSETDIPLVADGASEWKIVVPAGEDEALTFAATELRTIFETATGVRLDIVSDTEAAEPYFALGCDNALTKQAGVTLPTTLGRRGAYVRTQGKNVYLAGLTADGTINAVYEWARRQFGFEVYGTEEIVIGTDPANRTLKQIELTEVPDIEDLSSTYGWTDNDLATARRMRYTRDYWITDATFGIETYHNSFAWLPAKLYRAEHPNWYGTTGSQLCYRARGDADEYRAMVDTIVSRVEAVLMRTDMTRLTITQEDVADWCGCSACLELRNKYGTDAVGPIRFCNDVSRAVRDWFETEEGKPYARDLKIAFFAYHATQPAPVDYDASTDTYKPKDDTVVCDENVGVIYAPIRATYQKDFSDPYNTLYASTVRGWGAVTKNLFMWTYSTNFHYYFVPTNTYNSMQYNYRFIASNNAKWYLDQAQYLRIASGFSALKLFLNAKLAWNVNADFNALIDEWFENYFGPAAPSMRKVFDELRAHWAYLETARGYIGDCYLEPLGNKYWPATLLTKWLDEIDRANEAIAGLYDTDRVAWKMYADNILLESMSFRFLLLDDCADSLDAATLRAERIAFRDDCSTLGITNYSERAAIDQLWKSWGI